MISQFFVMSSRGDTIISRHFRRDVPKDSPATFFRQVKFWGGEKCQAPPVFHVEGVSYLYMKQSSLYFMVTTRQNVSPVLVGQLLVRFAQVFKDYCGILSEESIRKNFVLIYELLDELCDFGYPQDSSTEHLKAFVFNKPAEIPSGKLLPNLKLPEMNPKTTPSSSVNKSVVSDTTKQRNEIFVDIYERLSVTFSSSGYVTRSEIDGSIQLKSYLTGNPELRLALNEDLVVGEEGRTSQQQPQYGVVVIDDCNFHDCARLEEFESMRVLSFLPPEGEFVLMNYRITSPFRAPFKVFPSVEMLSGFQVEVVLKVRADIPEQNYGSLLEIVLPVPHDTASVSFEWGPEQRVHSDHSVEFVAKERKILWKVKKFPGAKEFTLRCKLTLSNSSSGSALGVRKEIGPVNLSFEIPMYNVSGLQVRYLRILETSKKYNPYRWVRYVSKSNSYACRI